MVFIPNEAPMDLMAIRIRAALINRLLKPTSMSKRKKRMLEIPVRPPPTISLGIMNPVQPMEPIAKPAVMII
jgi:hypothetical protein